MKMKYLIVYDILPKYTSTYGERNHYCNCIKEIEDISNWTEVDLRNTEQKIAKEISEIAVIIINIIKL